MQVAVATPEVFVSIAEGGDLFPVPADGVFLKTLLRNRRIRNRSALSFHAAPPVKAIPLQSCVPLAVKQREQQSAGVFGVVVLRNLTSVRLGSNPNLIDTTGATHCMFATKNLHLQGTVLEFD